MHRRTLRRFLPLLSLMVLFAAHAQGAEAKPNVVLVHGAFADGSSWSKVIIALQKAGYPTVAVQLPETSFADDVDATRRVLATQTGPTVLVGHSYGGAVITEAGADVPNIISLVYVAAFGPDVGETLAELTSKGPQPDGAKAIHESGGWLLVDAAAFPSVFAADVDLVTARFMAAVQTPIAAKGWGEKLTKAAWKGKPSFYIVAANDKMIPPDAERFFAKRMGATTITLPSSHAVMVSHAKEVTAFIEKAAKTPAKP